MTDIAIRVENLSKLYHIGKLQRRHDTLREALVDAVQAPRRRRLDRGPATGDRSASGLPLAASGQEDDLLWALRDVSFDVHRGEVIGIIGRNGAGKSTLLKILSRITEPTEGRAEINGRVGSLLEVGTGFHAELTGRENIYLNGAILGMRRAEIARKFEEIVAFAEIERFLDTPVKHYSSGMYVRLAFAVAAHLEPEILLVDEVLAVGDAQFQQKCLGKMESVGREGRTILFVSHNMTAIQALCQRVLVFDGGRAVVDGSAEQAVASYLSLTTARGEMSSIDLAGRQGSGLARIVSFRLLDAASAASSDIPMGSSVTLEFGIESTTAMRQIDLHIGMYSATLQPVCHFSSGTSGVLLSTQVGRYVVRCTVPALNLTVGQYILSLAIYNPLSWECIDRLPHVTSFNVLERDVFGSGRAPNPAAGSCFFPSTWDLQQA